MTDFLERDQSLTVILSLLLCQMVCHFLNCSKNINVNIVCGPVLIKEGVQPLKNESNPSDRNMFKVTRIADNLTSFPVALIMRVFITSTGEHAVVATRPY